jgi:hypothetical protein
MPVHDSPLRLPLTTSDSQSSARWRRDSRIEGGGTGQPLRNDAPKAAMARSLADCVTGS